MKKIFGSATFFYAVKKGFLVTSILSLSLLLASCGGGSSGGGNTTTPTEAVSCFTTPFGGGGAESNTYLSTLYKGREDQLAPEAGFTKYQSHSYYDLMDPEGKSATLDAWLKLNGFVAADSPVTVTGTLAGTNLVQPGVLNTQYVNAYDLGLGRDMYCREASSIPDEDKYACIVQNYRVSESLTQTTACAPEYLLSVTMEWNRDIDGKKDVTAFYVFDKTGGRVNQIDLDGHGSKSVPEACLGCHDGDYDRDTMNVVRGEYLPFDKELFRHFAPADESYRYDPNIASNRDFGPLNLRVVQLEKRRLELNYITDRKTANLGALPIDDFGEIGEGGIFRARSRITNGSNPQNDFPGHGTPDQHVAGGGAVSVNDRNVLGFYNKNCRLCHAFQRGDFRAKSVEKSSVSSTGTVTNTSGFNCQICHDTLNGGAGNLNPLKDVLCEGGASDIVMPNARVTHQALYNALDPRTFYFDVPTEAIINDMILAKYCISPDKLKAVVPQAQ